jgi:hypothetical protein
MMSFLTFGLWFKLGLDADVKKLLQLQKDFQKELNKEYVRREVLFETDPKALEKEDIISVILRNN